MIITDYVADSKDIADTDELKSVVIQNASKLEYGAYEVYNGEDETMIYSKFIEKSTEMKQLYGLNDDLSIEEQGFLLGKYWNATWSIFHRQP